ncbi:redoxin domain-containing protein [Antarcticibacterium flavum]|uniref:Redoxin domain-containing protein n=1 Tax=Antarcticibacterium flavum TaxID=2058175 RepID=A0A5B7X012_9FLAO|nr:MULTISPECIES: TlpA disulfide reductase family protein [Antarcticibacterium]MCM4158800.1 peroxiredoxin [Antarcticibacterium sp. W02-3]QCY68649.1 redoxin domain-containing protein [Antarcticibacterium flavum]
MKKILVVLMIASFFGCQEEHDGYSISGTIEGVEDNNMIYISRLEPNNQPTRIDSVSIQNESFSLDLEDVDQPALHFLSIEGLNGNVLYIAENEPIKFNIKKDDLRDSEIDGGRENEAFLSYLNHLKDLNSRVMELRTEMQQEMGAGNIGPEMMEEYRQREEKVKEEDLEIKKRMIEENPDAYVSALIVTDMRSIGASTAEVKQYFEMLSDNVKQTPMAQALKTNLDKVSAVDIGSKAPTFSGPNPDGEEISLQDAMGKVTLIDFWAAWCRPCRVENPNIVEVYEKYHDKGFNVIGVSLDRADQRDRWLQAIEDDNLTWTQISNLQFWEEPIAQLYGIRAIPAAFILDENGVIVAKNVRGPALEKKVKELLGE